MLGTVLALAVFVLIVVVLLHQLIGLANELPGYEDRLQSTWRPLSQKFLKLQQSGESLVPRHPRQVRTVEGVPWERLAVGTAIGLVALLGQATLALFVVYFFSPSPATTRGRSCACFATSRRARTRSSP
jgi:predicted PurR-regulated permease PerM